MTDKKLTDSEILKALECCGKYNVTHQDRYCNDCVFKGRGRCSAWLIDNIIGLINRLQAKVEGLELELADTKRNLQIVLDNSISAKLPHCVLCGKGAILTKSLKEYDELISDISAEAYKEFANELKCRTHEISCNTAQVVTRCDIDNLLKEMVGEDNAKEKE